MPDSPAADNSAAERPTTEHASADTTSEGPEPAAPAAGGPSKMRYVAIFFAGMLVGRIASQNFAAGPLGTLDLFMYVALALSVAWAWRSWARRAMVQRHLDAERRRGRAAQAAVPPASGAGGTSGRRPKRRRR